MKRRSNEGHNRSDQISRRELLKRMACGGLALTGAGTILSACSPDLIQAGDEGATPTAGRAPSYYLPTDEGLWTPTVSHRGDVPAGTGTLDIARVGRISFEAEEVTTVRPDIFQQGYFASRLLWLGIHKWTGLALSVTALLHLLLHGRWLVRMTKRVVGRSSERDMTRFLEHRSDPEWL